MEQTGIGPALSDTAWRRHLATPRHADGVAMARQADVVARSFAKDVTGRRARRQRHALAALALHEQPYGFTHADVDALRATADALEHGGVATQRAVPALRSIADRVERLLPPNEAA